MKIVLVSCVSLKAAEPARAKDLYISPWFKKARAYAEKNGERWFILSAWYGLVDPESYLSPYDASLECMSPQKRREWAYRAAHTLCQRLGRPNLTDVEIELLAGDLYAKPLSPVLTNNHGARRVVRPMQGLGIGQQLAWLTAQIAREVKP